MVSIFPIPNISLAAPLTFLVTDVRPKLIRSLLFLILAPRPLAPLPNDRPTASAVAPTTLFAMPL